MSQKNQIEDVEDSNAMYYCLKCDRKHRQLSSIGSWHSALQRPELEERGFRAPRSRPAPPLFAAAVALGLARREADLSEVRVSEVEDVWADEGFDEQFWMNADDALRALKDEYGAVIRRRHSGDEWVMFEADHALQLKHAAQEYARLGMSWGAYRD